MSTQFFKFNFSQGSIVPMDVGLFRDYFYLNMRKIIVLHSEMAANVMESKESDLK